MLIVEMNYNVKYLIFFIACKIEDNMNLNSVHGVLHIK